MPTTVSVVIPYFNGAVTIGETVASVIGQGMADAEIIVVDDFSERSPVEPLAGLGRAIRVFRNDRTLGPGAARNVGLAHARGRYVCFLDQDDQYHPSFFGDCLRFLDAHPGIAALTTGMELLDCHREVSPIHRQLMEDSLPGNLMVRTAVARLVGGFPEDPAFRGRAAGEDIAFRQALARHFALAHMPLPYFRYRVKKDGAFDFFMDRTSVADGRLVFHALSAEEADGSLGRAAQAYHRNAAARIAACHPHSMTSGIPPEAGFARNRRS